MFATDCTAHISHPEITKCVVGSLAVKGLMLSLVTGTICASEMFVPAEKRKTPQAQGAKVRMPGAKRQDTRYKGKDTKHKGQAQHQR